MMLVTDASVTAKWLFEEVDSGRARSLLDGVRDGNLMLIAPEIMSAEVSNVLWKRVQRGELRADEAIAHYDRFRRISPTLVRISPLAEGALRFALQYHHSVYDCLYVALAIQAGCNMVTADRKLFDVFSPVFPRVQLLANLEFS